jgi:hypothetical protein
MQGSITNIVHASYLNEGLVLNELLGASVQQTHMRVTAVNLSNHIKR